MEAGFKIRPGQGKQFWPAQWNMEPTGVAQPGFVSRYSGPIVNSSWRYYGVRFETPEFMDAWHKDPRHRAVQQAAREKWWTAFYIRKWRRPLAEEPFADRIFADTRIRRNVPLSPSQLEELCRLLAALPTYGVKPFETLSGEFEPQPYQLIGPLKIVPHPAPGEYSLLTHWRTRDDLSRFEEGPEYAALQSIGSISTEAFVPMVESNQRLGVRKDRLQRDWTLDGKHPQAETIGA
jgi:heme-degrading monooxygenase HmoA